VERNSLEDEERPLFADEGAAEKADALPAQMARMRAEAAANFMLMEYDVANCSVWLKSKVEPSDEGGGLIGLWLWGPEKIFVVSSFYRIPTLAVEG
jgi:hypothetical protein